MNEVKEKNIIARPVLQKELPLSKKDKIFDDLVSNEIIQPEGYAQLINFINSHQSYGKTQEGLNLLLTPAIAEMPIQNSTTNPIPLNQDPPNGNSTIPQELSQISIEDFFQLDNFVNINQKSWGRELASNLNDNLFWLHNIIITSFYALFILTIFFSVFSVAITIWEYIKKHDETAILKVSEHIFLSLLPIFIVFGFYNYYKSNTQNKLIGKSFPRNNDESSTKTMNLTKTLFLSSIISYVMIKIIEVIFLSPVGEPLDMNKILLSLLLLGILMIYFILFDRKPH